MRITKSDIAAAVFLIILIVFMFTAKPSICIVDGSSMEPTIHDRQVLLAFKPSQVERYDIVIIKLEDGDTIIKRVIGIPGDTVHIYDGRVYVNEEIADNRQTDYAGLVVIPFTLGEGHYFVLGDNRENSIDSRYPKVSIVDKEQIIKKVVFVD